MAIWRLLLRPALPWIARAVAVALAALAAAYIAGRVAISRAEPDAGGALPAGVAGRLVDAGGRLVHVVERGDGPPLVLVHGFAGSTYDWEEQVLGPLAERHHVVAVDLLGMGFSARAPDLAYGWALWSEQLVATLDALGITRASVAGHSLGGAVAAIFAGEHGERVERLVLVAPLVPLEQSERTWVFKLAEIPGLGEPMLGFADHLPRLPGFSDPYHARAHDIFRIRGTRDGLLRYLRHGRDTARLVGAYRRITAPTLVVHGTADDIVPFAAMKRWAPAIHEALVLPLDGVGHWIMRDAPDACARAVTEFLTGGPRPPLTGSPESP